MNNITFQNNIQDLFSKSPGDLTQTTRQPLQEGQVIDGRVVSADNESQITLRLLDGSLLRARLDSGVIPPQSGEAVSLQVVSLPSADGILKLRLVDVNPNDLLSVNTLTDSGAVNILNYQSPNLPTNLEALVTALRSLGLPVTLANLMAMDEILNSPPRELAPESSFVPPESFGALESELASEVSAQNPVATANPAVMNETGIPAVVLRLMTSELINGNRSDPASDAVPNSAQNATSETMTSIPNPNSNITAADVNTNTAAAVADNRVAETRSFEPTELAPDRAPGLGSPNVTAQTENVAQTRLQNSPDISQATNAANTSSRETPISEPQNLRDSIVTAGGYIQAPLDEPVKYTNGAALRQAAFELPARLAVLSDELERELARIGSDDPKAAGLRVRRDEIEAVREHIVNTREPDNRFIYAQIPLHINERRTTAELYVYKNPKSGKTRIDPENTKILLSLDFETFQHVEALISIHGKELSISFSSNREETVQVLRRESIALFSVMQSVGYKLTSIDASLTREKTTQMDAMLRLLVNANEAYHGLDISA